MSFRGRGGGRGSFSGGRGGRGGRGGGRGFQRDEGPPDEVVEAGKFRHECEGEMVITLTNEKVGGLPISLQGMPSANQAMY